MKYQGIIFDLDGVICHTDKYHYQAWKKLADKLEVYFDEVINNRLRGVSRMESLNIILEKCDRELTIQEKEACAKEKNEFYKELLKNMTTEDLSQEVRETLEQLREKGLKLAIGSSSKTGFRGIFKGSAVPESTTRAMPGCRGCRGRTSGSQKRKYGLCRYRRSC